MKLDLRKVNLEDSNSMSLSEIEESPPEVPIQVVVGEKRTFE